MNTYLTVLKWLEILIFVLFTLWGFYASYDYKKRVTRRKVSIKEALKYGFEFGLIEIWFYASLISILVALGITKFILLFNLAEKLIEKL